MPELTVAQECLKRKGAVILRAVGVEVGAALLAGMSLFDAYGCASAP